MGPDAVWVYIFAYLSIYPWGKNIGVVFQCFFYLKLFVFEGNSLCYFSGTNVV